MKPFLRRVVDRVVHGSLARANMNGEPHAAVEILARELVSLRRRVASVAWQNPTPVEEIQKVAVDTAVAVRTLRLDLEAEATSASARFAYLRQELGRYLEETTRTRELTAENAERAGDTLLGFRQLAAETLALFNEQSEAVRANLPTEVALHALVDERIANLAARMAAIEDRQRRDPVEGNPVRALEDNEQSSRTLPGLPNYDSTAFDAELFSTNGSAGHGALADRFDRAFAMDGAKEREAVRLLVRGAQRVLSIGEAPLHADGFTSVTVDEHAGASALRDIRHGTYDAIIALTYPERCEVEERFELLRRAHHATKEHGRLILGITNGYAPEAWRRFHLDPWNTHPWMPDTWRFAFASAGFCGVRFYDTMRHDYVSDVASAGGRVLVIGYR